MKKYYQIFFRYIDVFVNTREKINDLNIQVSGIWFNTLKTIIDSMAYIIISYDKSDYLINIMMCNISSLFLLVGVDLKKTQKEYKSINGGYVHHYDCEVCFDKIPQNNYNVLNVSTYKELLNDYNSLPKLVRSIFKDSAKDVIESNQSFYNKILNYFC